MNDKRSPGDKMLGLSQEADDVQYSVGGLGTDHPGSPPNPQIRKWRVKYFGKDGDNHDTHVLLEMIEGEHPGAMIRIPMEFLNLNVPEWEALCEHVTGWQGRELPVIEFTITVHKSKVEL
jgi:hypothetical protein